MHDASLIRTAAGQPAYKNHHPLLGYAEGRKWTSPSMYPPLLEHWIYATFQTCSLESRASEVAVVRDWATVIDAGTKSLTQQGSQLQRIKFSSTSQLHISSLSVVSPENKQHRLARSFVLMYPNMQCNTYVAVHTHKPDIARGAVSCYMHTLTLALYMMHHQSSYPLRVVLFMFVDWTNSHIFVDETRADTFRLLCNVVSWLSALVLFPHLHQEVFQITGVLLDAEQRTGCSSVPDFSTHRFQAAMK